MMLPDFRKYILPPDTRISAEAWKDWQISYVSAFTWIHMTETPCSFFVASGQTVSGLLWEGDGFLLLYKRLDTGAFNWPRSKKEALAITPEQYAMLMQGLEIIARHPIEQTTDPRKLI